MKETKKAVAVYDDKGATITKRDEVMAADIRKLGVEIIQMTVDVGRKYLELCQYIRKNAVAPKMVSEELSAIGFHRVRVSEINRVANAPDDVWEEFQARTIGFKKVLQLTRGNVEKISEVGGIEDQEELEKLAKESEIRGEEEPVAGLAVNTGEGKAVLTPAERLTKMVKAVLSLCAKENVKPRTWHHEGYALSVLRYRRASKKQSGKEAPAPAA